MPASAEQFADLTFPIRGLDLSQPYSQQVPGTTALGQNVRTFDVQQQRQRGGQRPGLSKYIAQRLSGTALVQEINSVVGVGYSAVPASYATPLLIQTKTRSTQASVSSFTLSFDAAVTSGNAVVLCIQSGGGNLPSAVSDNHGNTYTLDVSRIGISNLGVSIYHSLNVTGGATLTLTVTFAGANGPTAVAYELSGLGSVDKTSSNTGTGLAATTGAVSPGLAAEVGFLILNCHNGPAATLTSSGFTEDLSLGGSFPVSTAHKLTIGTSSLNGSWTNGGAGTDWCAAVATFVPATAVAGQTAQSGRVVTLVGVSGGAFYTASPGGLAWTAAINATGQTVASGVARSTSLNQKLYLVDGVNYFICDPSTSVAPTVTLLTATAGSLPAGSDSGVARLCCTWRGRLVVSGLLKDAQNWFMAKIGDPTNWDYFPTNPSPDQAVAGNNADFGKVGDVITALIPYSDDVLIFGGDHTIWQLRGDPMSGGQLDRVSDAIGMAWGAAWEKDPQGNLYFVSNKTGIYTMQPGQLPTRISGPIEQLIQPINTGSTVIRLLWNDRMQGLHVFISNASIAAVGTNFFWEQRTGAWWKDVYPASMQPLCLCTFDGNLPGDRHPLIGSWDGYVRQLTLTATDDDGTAITSQVLLGPLLTRDLDAILVKDLRPVLGEESGTVSWQILGGLTAEAALASAQSQPGGTWTAGLNYTTPVRYNARVHWLLLSSTSAWALERVSARIQTQGKVQRRGR